MKKDQRDNQLTEAEIQQKLQEIENNFKCVPEVFDGVGFCAKSFDENGKLITQEPDEKSKK
ncbi:MAG: hypothetical protein EIB84_04650 [Spiroplasma poulsonii]|uniref:Uncharacterized protein n=2 Tax=Spiroplasma poulsonii TaxID=2138 RepID=A0A2P6FAR7_9MOLU|nr:MULTISPECIES: hypothetical protein [Spiroplasma]KAF0851764.1 hypothetical protein MSROBK_003540 [Spiroplasma poulsonii]MBH8622862.1 hypothetical protein [Spiroplasma sp. hyd1]MBW1242107.1 hypothetical protein [Spiroplasma poulsonii]MBW3058621.1 hypothetical protein [Spiroplasma poulsonii]PQM30553.1 hypothetical protein SMSRO_SF003220 [Spiroplasma poulsonii]